MLRSEKKFELSESSEVEDSVERMWWKEQKKKHERQDEIEHPSSMDVRHRCRHDMKI